MDAPALAAVLHEAEPALAAEALPSLDRQPTLAVPADQLKTAARVLRDHPRLRFALLVELTAVDFFPREPRFEVVYLLVSIEHQLRLRLKVRLADGASVPTVSDLWPAADWLEREVWDLFGIVFDGHPDPRRLLMPEDWEGYPLRKDYPVQIRKKPQTGSALQVTEAEFRANVERDRLTRG